MSFSLIDLFRGGIKMDFMFDHLVHYVEEPNDVIPYLKQKGIHAVEGGKHGNRPTYNTLSYFDLSYIEYIGTSNRQELEKINHPRFSNIETIINDQYKEGFVRFVVRTNNIEAAAEHFRSKGLTVVGPTPLSRKRPDGTWLEWKLLYVGSDDEQLQLPYVIEWGESDEERRTELKNINTITEHPSGAVFSNVTFAVHNNDDIIKQWADWLDLKEFGRKYVDHELNATCRTLDLPGGQLVFASPLSEGIVADVLTERGEKPFQVNFNSKIDQSFKMFGGMYHMMSK